ncbi:MAG: protein-disulfide reductase DsbD family protein [Chlamydiales bacterium]
MVSLTPTLGASEQPLSSPVSVSILAEGDAAYTEAPSWIAVRLFTKEGWHTYWKNPGTAGYPIEVEWKLPEGLSVSDLHWPYPKKEMTDVGATYYYDGETWLLAKLEGVPKDLEGKEVQLSATVRWLACSATDCLPGESEQSITIPVKDKPSVEGTHFSQARHRLAKLEHQVVAKQSGTNVELWVPVDFETVTTAYFCPASQKMIDEAQELRVRKGDEGLHITLTAHDEGEELQKIIEGTLVIEHEEGAKAIDISEVYLSSSKEIALAEKTTLPMRDESTENVNFFTILFFAFLGGLILNMMPCVLPVISIKILGFTKMANDSRMAIFKNSLAFCFGVLISFWVLAGLLLVLQAYGHAVGWGFQLQEPLFVASLAAVILIFGLSLFGLFEIGTGVSSAAGNMEAQSSSKRHPLIGSFLSGILATTVATPCTGPFLGSAIGFAVTVPPLEALTIFTSLGLGMASPYLLVAAFPSMLKIFPKPGDWMVTFKEILGFIMILTTLWLMWVFAGQTSSLSLFILMLGFFFLAIGCWCYGKWGSPIRKKKVRWMGYIIALTFFCMGGYIIYASTDPALVSEAVAVESSKQGQDGWEAFSESRVQELQSNGTPVFIDFTARWCLTCQANHVVFSIPEVKEKLQQYGVVKMKADWTKYDPEITAALKKYGRSGVPLYLLFGKDPNKPPQILPQVLTPDIVIRSMEQI